MSQIRELCRERTTLGDKDIQIIEEMADYLQIYADISQADVFIDCPVPEKGAALVVAQAHPKTAPSLYKTSVVGQLAYAKHEPAVLFSLLSGQPVIGSRGISQEDIVMQQNVVPIQYTGRIIGAFILEQDISDKVEQEKNVELLMETTEQLSETLLGVAMSEGQVPSLMHEGLVLIDHEHRITYTNARAFDLLISVGNEAPVKGQKIEQMFFGKLSKDLLLQGGMFCEELQMGAVCLEVKYVSLYRAHQAVGGMILIRDITDLKEKEKQLMIKSAVIKEIHHRVKNNLQTVSSLLRLQMRRIESEEVKGIFLDSINRINSIAVIHEILSYDGLNAIDFKEVVERIGKIIISSTAKPDQTIGINVSGAALLIPADKATTLALVINELIQNCVVHAFSNRKKGFIEIELFHNNQIVQMHLSDDGIGIGDYSASILANRSRLGLKIVETLVKEDLCGILEFNDYGLGTEVQITFPFRRD